MFFYTTEPSPRKNDCSCYYTSSPASSGAAAHLLSVGPLECGHDTVRHAVVAVVQERQVVERLAAVQAAGQNTRHVSPMLLHTIRHCRDVQLLRCLHGVRLDCATCLRLRMAVEMALTHAAASSLLVAVNVRRSSRVATCTEQAHTYNTTQLTDIRAP